MSQSLGSCQSVWSHFVGRTGRRSPSLETGPGGRGGEEGREGREGRSGRERRGEERGRREREMAEGDEDGGCRRD